MLFTYLHALRTYISARCWIMFVQCCRAFSYDVTAAILVFQNKETAAILLYQSIPPGIKLYFYAKIVFCFYSRPANMAAGHVSENALFLVFMLCHKILKSKFNRPAKLWMSLGVR